MASEFETAFEMAAEPLFEQWFRTEIQIRRGGVASSAFTAVWCAQEYQSIEHETGLAVAVKKRVYRFLKTSAVITSVTITPRAGDEIIDDGEVMRILAVQGKPAVEDEPGGYRWLVRTDKLA